MTRPTGYIHLVPLRLFDIAYVLHQCSVSYNPVYVCAVYFLYCVYFIVVIYQSLVHIT